MERQALPGARPHVIQLGAILLGLQNVFSSLQTLLTNATGDIKSIGEQLQHNIQEVIADFDNRFGNRLKETLEALEGLERRMAEDAEALIHLTQRAMQEIQAGVIDSAKVALFEADITAVNAASMLPCQPQRGRFVYAYPFQMRAGINVPEVALRGNFLLFAPPNITLEGRQAEIIASSEREIRMKIPQELLDQVTTPRSFAIKGAPSTCEPKILGRTSILPGSEQSVSFLVLPRLIYNVYAVLRPTANVPIRQLWPFDYYRWEEDCDANFRDDKNYCVPPDWRIEQRPNAIRWRHTTQNCGSQVNRVVPSGDRCAWVEAQIVGCGGDIFGCDGHGWLGYVLHVDAFTMQRRPLERFEWHVVAEDQRAFTVTYPHTVPPDAQAVHWGYDVKVVIMEGSAQKLIELSDVNPNVGIVTTRVDRGVLSIQIGEGARLARVRN